MELKWVYDPNTRISKTQITPELYYTTNDGGQTIKKYVNNELVNTFHKYGPDFKFTETAWSGTHIDNIGLDEWTDEVRWIAENYKDVVGEFLPYWDKGFLNKNGEIEDIGKTRGMGVLSADKPISINRICQPSSVQEMWDYEEIAYTDKDVAEDCRGTGTRWMRHKETGQVVRMAKGLVPFPCCAFPTVHGPWPVDESDIDTHGGKRILSLLMGLLFSKKLAGALATSSAFVTFLA